LAYTYAKRGEQSIVDESVLEQNSEVPSIEVPSVNASDLENSVPSVESLEMPNAVIEQIESEGAQQLEELRTQVEGVIEENKEKAAE